MYCDIHINNALECEINLEVLSKTMLRVVRDITQLRKVEIFVSNRVPADAPAHKFPGSIEWGLNFEFKSGSKMYIGIIQRSVGAVVEFHS